MERRWVYLLSSLLVIIFVSCGDSLGEKQIVADFESLSGPYFGLQLPGDEAQIFMPGLITTAWDENCIAFLNGGRVCIWSVNKGEGLETYHSYERDGAWTEPAHAPFEDPIDHPSFTAGPDDRTLYFHSGRATHPGDERLDDNIWAIEWDGDGWSEPTPLPPPVSTELGEAYPTLAASGNVYYFCWSREDCRMDDIYRCVKTDDGYLESRRLPYPVNSDYIEYDPWAAPDESYLVFSSNRPGGYGSVDLYAAFLSDDGSWTPPVNLGKAVNTSRTELCPVGTPDGRYLFFVSNRDSSLYKGERSAPVKPDMDTYWVSTAAIDGLKDEVISKKSAAEEIAHAYVESGIEEACGTLAKLHSSERDSHYFLPFELMSLCGEMIAAGEVEDSDRFYRALLDTFDGDIRFKRGYPAVCAMNGRVREGAELMKQLAAEDAGYNLEEELSILGYMLTKYPEKQDDALDLLEVTIEEFPESFLAHYSMARLLRDKGDIESAIEHARRALELEPGSGDTVQLLESLEAQQ